MITIFPLKWIRQCWSTIARACSGDIFHLRWSRTKPERLNCRSVAQEAAWVSPTWRHLYAKSFSFFLFKHQKSLQIQKFTNSKISSFNQDLFRRFRLQKYLEPVSFAKFFRTVFGFGFWFSVSLSVFAFGCKNFQNRFRFLIFGFGFGFRFRLQKFSEPVSVSVSDFRFRFRFPVSVAKIFRIGFGFGFWFSVSVSGFGCKNF